MGYVSIDVDTDEIMSDIRTRDMTKELSTRFKASEHERSKIMEWIKTELRVTMRDAINGDNLIDDFKAQLLRESMNRFTLDQLEERLK